MIPLTLSEKIRLVRKTKGITQQTMADRLSMTVSAYNMKENGKRSIDTDELEEIAAIFEVPVAVFFQETFHVKWNEGEVS